LSQTLATKEWWTRQVSKWRVEAERLGGVHLATTMSDYPDETSSCIDHWLFEGATFVDFVGTYTHGKRIVGIPEGFLFVSFHTWTGIEPSADEIWTNASIEPQPRAPGIRAFVVQQVLGPLFEKLIPATKPIRMFAPSDFEKALTKHRESIRASGDRIFTPPSSDPLAWRWKFQEELEREAEHEE
jgi:hypothetical protein